MGRAPSVGRVLQKGLDKVGGSLMGENAADLKKRADLARAQRDWVVEGDEDSVVH